MLASRNSPNCKPDCHLTTTPQVPSTHVNTPAATCAELGGRRNTTCTPSNARAPHARCSGQPCTYNDNLSQRPQTQTHQIVFTSGTMSRQNIRWGTANMHASCTTCQHRASPSAPAQRQCAGKEIILFGLKVTAASTPHREDPIIGIHRWYKLVHASLCWWRSFCLRGVGQGIPLLEPQAAHNAHNGHACNRTGQHSTASSQCISASYQQCHLLAQHKGDKLAHPASCGRG